MPIYPPNPNLILILIVPINIIVRPSRRILKQDQIQSLVVLTLLKRSLLILPALMLLIIKIVLMMLLSLIVLATRALVLVLS